MAATLDPDDPRLDPFRGLRRRDRGISEKKSGLVVAEGLNVARELARSRFPLTAVLSAPDQLDHARELVAGSGVDGADAELFVLDAKDLDRIVGFHVHQRVLAAGERRDPPPLADVLAGARTVVVLEETNDPVNLGAMFRTSAALGADAVLLGPRSADPLYRRTVRVSMGHALHLPYGRLGELPDSLAVLEGFRTVALAPYGEGVVSIDEVDLGAERVAVVLGAEGPGLQATTAAACDARAAIPMAAGVDSLNVGVALGIALDHRRRAVRGQDTTA